MSGGPRPGGFTADPLAAEVEAASVEGVQLRPDSSLLRREGWVQLTTPSSKQPWLNGVLLSVLSPAAARARVAEVAASYRALGARFRWSVGPSTRPRNMGPLLARQALTLVSEAAGMVAPVNALSLPPPSEVRVERVAEPTVSLYLDTVCAGWGVSGALRRELEDDVRRELAFESSWLSFYLAFHRDQPAGGGALKLLRRSGYLMGSAVRPEHRGRGVYRALVAARVEALSALGKSLVTIEASRATAAPICARLGFREVCVTQRYEG